MRITHDEHRCASTGMCEAAAPEVFAMGIDGVLVVLAPDPAEELREVAEAAVAACPTQALRFAD